jgi:uncharacterized damage-inducible protein DinB
MKKEQLIAAVQTEHVRWETALRQIDKTQMTQPGVSGNWTIKDLIAHVTWHEREMVGVVGEMALVGSEWWNLSTDERNAAIYEAHKERPLDDVLTEAKEVHHQLLDALQTLSDEALVDPHHFRHMPDEWIPWQIIADNTFDHYRQHLPDIQTWVENSKT